MRNNSIEKCLQVTGRFAAMAGVARRTIKRELHRYCLVASVLRPATAASRWDVSSNAATVRWDKAIRLETTVQFDSVVDKETKS
jgi:hypothetical protein